MRITDYGSIQEICHLYMMDVDNDSGVDAFSFHNHYMNFLQVSNLLGMSEGIQAEPGHACQLLTWILTHRKQCAHMPNYEDLCQYIGDLHSDLSFPPMVAKQKFLELGVAGAVVFALNAMQSELRDKRRSR